MNQIAVTFTIFFEAPFWKGIYERQECNKSSVALVVFGAESKDFEVAQFLTEHFHTLSFSNTFITKKTKAIQNYKRLQRTINRQIKQNGIGTKSQQALKQQRELSKTEHKQKRTLQKRMLQQQQFEIKQQKKKQKKKGH